ncbi:hypothetical protein KP003_09115 [Geomonas nitrogeniifigens]|uniref:hypothetical protein n=1 Tax=Geomonas diazotrophica TaxID=2843197 RepID=UPI001C2BEEA6|nr:hypothetical protein [Geomonas nitrogeniifigens]QXE88536.1 hypothetical protein KP003_09115 [Geomonas nitrogeniifigens]
MRSLFFLLLLVIIPVSAYAIDCTQIPTDMAPGGPISQFRSYQKDGYAYIPGPLIGSETGDACLGKGTENTYFIFTGDAFYRTCVPTSGGTCDNLTYWGTYSKYSITKIACDVPPPPDPTTYPNHCSNKAQDVDETGIDCGGSCKACIKKCPNGTSEFYVKNIDGTGEGGYVCAAVVLPDSAGNCPNGYQKTKTADSTIYPTGTPICAAPSDYVDVSPDVGPENTPTVEPPPNWQTGTTSYTDFGSGSGGTTTNPNTSTTTNEGTKSGAPAGTQSYTTTTTVSSKTYNTGTTTQTTTTTTTTNNYYSGPGGTGDKLGSDTTTEEQGLPEDNPSNYDYNPAIAPDGPISIGESEYGQGPNWESIKTNIDSKLQELSDSITGNQILTSDPTCAITGSIMGRSYTISFCKYQSFLESMGVFLLAVTYLAGFIYLFDRG